MANAYHHALSSQRRWGGEVEDYLEIHRWLDQSKMILSDYRHRALRHHSEGATVCEQVFGQTITLSTGRVIPTRWVAERHIIEDLGFIPSAADWLRAIRTEPWMNNPEKLSRTFVQKGNLE